MSSEVKRYDPINSDGTCGTCVEDPDYGAYVEFADYAALEADRDRLKVIADNYYALLVDANAELAKPRAGQETDEYPPCDYCGVVTDYHPWHGSGLINGRESPHIHACNECRHLLPSTPQPSAVPGGWEESLNKALVLETERAIKQRDKFIETGISTAGHGGSHDTCFAAIVRQHIAMLSAPSAPATGQGDGWIPVSERLPQIKQVLSEKCTLEGREIPTLYRSGFVITFDGKQVSAGIVEWFHGKNPLSGVTHWMPLPAAPAHHRMGEGDGCYREQRDLCEVARGV